jgi:ribonuclease P protein component|tara:strand:+ start:102 stop:371 length:270 start_codon:yes stop_codon:yes gene_type:complete
MKTAKSFTTEDLSFKYLLDEDPHLGFSVSAKYGCAVQRNLFKRRCRSLFMRILVDAGLPLSLIVRPKSKNISYQSIVSSFSAVYEKFAT